MRAYYIPIFLICQDIYVNAFKPIKNEINTVLCLNIECLINFELHTI